MKTENYFSNKETCVSHFRENLKLITFQRSMRNKLQIRNNSGRRLSPFCQVEVSFQSSDRINLTKESDSLIANYSDDNYDDYDEIA